ncbi:MAG TPA: nuclear transport factor 2 family protein [Steroidobacteraceae bacterium]|nr:nuclear transport factor 2 family protein [Steroidobacteraceae bacterium]HXS32047.1 nuclear transport factor 2 family protein [Steroidobacteraceae bacterium]
MTAFSSSDRLEIHELTARYAWSLDTGDEDAFVACFCNQGELVWDVFETEGRWRGPQALRRFIAYFRQRPESAGRQHHVSNLVVTPSDRGARARSYVAVAVRRAEGPHVLNVMGYYEDELEREDGRWRFAHRFIRDWSGPVLAGFAGQDGARSARPLPDALAGLWATQG